MEKEVKPQYMGAFTSSRFNPLRQQCTGLLSLHSAPAAPGSLGADWAVVWSLHWMQKCVMFGE